MPVKFEWCFSIKLTENPVSFQLVPAVKCFRAKSKCVSICRLENGGFPFNLCITLGFLFSEFLIVQLVQINSISSLICGKTFVACRRFSEYASLTLEKIIFGLPLRFFQPYLTGLMTKRLATAFDLPIFHAILAPL
ncbi:hypothetical protein NPIL_237301 [Nephila pilipes]|uniref:Uncharacterized protein n=1 Tax=Nephila pilipes TaxID=299642 RepID=A0A8X6NCP4_NEPPI|nr:hypothetical protein NPIL_237301 [Nephila pilipes]